MRTDFDLHQPRSLEAALDRLARTSDNGAPAPLAGGTNLLVDIRARTAAPRALLALGRVRGLRGISIGAERISLGACTTVSDLLRNLELHRQAPSLIAAARVFAGQMVRNTATVGGNLCYGSPAADLVAPLLALDAELTLASRGGARTLPLAEFLVDYKRTARRDDELLTGVSWRRPGACSSNLFQKLARRRGDAITVVGVAVAVSAAAGRCRGARIALAAVAPTVVRARGAERVLEGEVPTPERIDEAAGEALAATRAIDDVRASAGYRRHCTYVLVRRLLERGWKEALSAGEAT